MNLQRLIHLHFIDFIDNLIAFVINSNFHYNYDIDPIDVTITTRSHWSQANTELLAQGLQLHWRFRNLPPDNDGEKSKIPQKFV